MSERLYVRAWEWGIERGMLNTLKWRAKATVELSDGTYRIMKSAACYTRGGAKRVAMRWLRTTLGFFGEKP